MRVASALLLLLFATQQTQALTVPKNPAAEHASALKTEVGIFGADDRALAYNHPVYNTVQQIVTATDGICSAVLIGRNYALTAGHCVENGRPKGMLIDSGKRFTAAIAIAQYWRARNYEWVEDRYRMYLREDFAILRLDVEAPAELGYLDIATPEEAAAGVAAISVGYPGYTYNGEWRVKDNNCSIRSAEADILRTDCAMSRGNSGGPLLVKGKDGKWKVAGISSTQFMYDDDTMVVGEPYRDSRANYYTNVTLYGARIWNTINTDRAARGLSR